MVQDGPGDQMRKIGDEQGVVDEVVFLHVATRGVDQECNLGEGEERNAQRQDDLADANAGRSPHAQMSRKKFAYL